MGEAPVATARRGAAVRGGDRGDRVGRLWAERDADLRADTQRLARELPDNLFGREVWEKLEPSTRTFVASAEAVFRARRDDPAFDFSGPAIEYAKTVETQLNALNFPRLRKRLGGAFAEGHGSKLAGAFAVLTPGQLRIRRPDR